VLFIVQGLTYALTSGIDARVPRANVLTGLLSIVVGTISISGAFAARRFIADWWVG
jgi:hypothetical protein